MRLFGHKHKDGAEKPVKSKKKTNKKAFARKFKLPSDVKLAYQMPIAFVIGIVCFISSIGWMMHNNTIHNQQVLASSMKLGEALPIFGGDTKGALTLGHMLLSKDGKTLAVEIKYDDQAHSQLSSFGNRYRLRLVNTHDNPMHVSMSYGLFGTDGSGVLTVHSSKGFVNKSFIVMLVDNGQLVSSDDLNAPNSLSDDSIDKSIYSELSAAPTSDANSASQSSSRAKLPPIYYARLNAKNSAVSHRNWSNDQQMIEDLFIRDNLGNIRKDMVAIKSKVSRANKTMAEMTRRIKENPNDTVAQNNITSVSGSLATLNASYITAKKRYEKLKDSSISRNILAPKQTKFSTFTIDDLQAVQPNQ